MKVRASRRVPAARHGDRAFLGHRLGQADVSGPPVRRQRGDREHDRRTTASRGVIVVDHDIEADDMGPRVVGAGDALRPKRSAQIIDRGRSTPLDPGLLRSRRATSRAGSSSTPAPYEWKNKPQGDLHGPHDAAARLRPLGSSRRQPGGRHDRRLTRPEAPARRRPRRTRCRRGRRRKGVVVICNLDTRGEDASRSSGADRRAAGTRRSSLDFSMEERRPSPATITTEEVAAQRGLPPIETVREVPQRPRHGDEQPDPRRVGDRRRPAARRPRARRDRHRRWHGDARRDLGRSSCRSASEADGLADGRAPRPTSTSTSARATSRCTTVLDIVKMNPLLKAQIVNAVGAICGMVE